MRVTILISNYKSVYSECHKPRNSDEYKLPVVIRRPKINCTVSYPMQSLKSKPMFVLAKISKQIKYVTKMFELVFIELLL